MWYDDEGCVVRIILRLGDFSVDFREDYSFRNCCINICMGSEDCRRRGRVITSWIEVMPVTPP